MRAFDCSDPAHGKKHFTGRDDDELFGSIRSHADEAHPGMTDDQIRAMMAGADWWQEAATSGTNAGSSPAAYDV